MRHIGGERHLAKWDFFVRSFDRELTVGEFDVGVGGFHQMGSDFFRFRFNFVQGLHDGSTTHRDRARTVGAHAKRHATGVAVDDIDVFYWNAQTRCNHLCECGFVALAVAV